MRTRHRLRISFLSPFTEDPFQFSQTNIYFLSVKGSCTPVVKNLNWKKINPTLKNLQKTKKSICAAWFCTASVADPGCLFWNPDPNFFHHGSRILTQKFSLSSRKYDPGCSFRIRIPDPDFSRIPDPGVQNAQDPGTGYATLSTA
jgi:hypothetical protein